jgi:protein O-GlcNAc transferase
LLVHARSAAQRQQVIDTLEALRVEAGRCDFVGRVPLREYFETYGKIDVGLDSFPCAGGTTTCDALWMGVPVVTLGGETAVARGGVSILSNAGHPQWVAATPEEYIEIAVSLAGDKERLAAIRGRLREEMRGSALMDARRFARQMEEVYVMQWDRWCREG